MTQGTVCQACPALNRPSPDALEHFPIPSSPFSSLGMTFVELDPVKVRICPCIYQAPYAYVHIYRQLHCSAASSPFLFICVSTRTAPLFISLFLVIQLVEMDLITQKHTVKCFSVAVFLVEPGDGTLGTQWPNGVKHSSTQKVRESIVVIRFKKPCTLQKIPRFLPKSPPHFTKKAPQVTPPPILTKRPQCIPPPPRVQRPYPLQIFCSDRFFGGGGPELGTQLD